MRNKKGWIRILEATIAVMIVATVMVVVYSQRIDRGVTSEDYFYNLEKQILADVASRSDLRLAVLRLVEEPPDSNYNMLNDFINSSIPNAFNYTIRICKLGSDDYCRVSTEIVTMTKDKDVFVEEVVISADLDGGVHPEFNPRKLRLFVWEIR